MSYAIRRRTTALAFAGLLVGLPLAASPAWAAPSSAAPLSAAQLGEPEAAPGVDFGGGGLGVLLCGSRPATPKITVGAEAKVKLTNKLGQGATLRIDGEDSANVADGETIEVQFHRGPVTVAMVPQCLLNLNPKFEELTVDVSPRVTGLRTPTPSSSAQPSTGPGSSSTKTNPPAKPDRKKLQPPTSGSNTTPEYEVPPPTGELFPDPTDSSDVAPSESPATIVNPDGTVANPKLASSVPVDKGPIGLLAIIATVCVVGVAAGAIRAIISQRATRAEFA